MKKDKEKITNFDMYRIPDETEEDRAFDREIRRKFAETENREAWRIQQDQPMEDDGRSQELYQKIVQNLREKGMWNDEAFQEAVREEQQQEAYDHLSEEDRYALERGRKVVLREKKWKFRLKKFRNVAAGVLIVVGIFSVSMASEANREQAMRIWTTITGFGQNIQINKSDDRLNRVTEVDDAIKDIKEKLGIDAPKFGYLPKGIEYESCEINEEIGFAKIMYNTNNNSLLYIYMTKEEVDIESTLSVDGKVVDEYSGYIQILEKDAVIEKIRQAENDYIYKAEFVERDTFYILFGEIEKDTFEKILNKLYL